MALPVELGGRNARPGPRFLRIGATRVGSALHMLAHLGLLFVGGLMLYFGAEWLVRGGAGLALAMGVRPLVIGLTVIAYATSAPELVVSTLATWQGKSEVALGNVVGSNIANIGLILGLTALIATPSTDGRLARREIAVLIVATLALPLSLLDGVLDRIEATLFLLGSLAFTLLALRWSRQDGMPEEPEELTRGLSKRRLAFLLAFGLVVLVAGGQLFVKGAVRIALDFGVSERVVGLTIVAVGTSLPELAASLVAAARGHAEMAVGNVVGSNIFNLLLVLGAAGLLLPIQAQLSTWKVDLVVMGALTAFCAFSLRRHRTITRLEGALLTAAYLGFVLRLAL